MKIAELFYSIQGEGMLAGTPAVFIRTSGCNLRCVWCDAAYTSWAPEGQEMRIGEIVDYVRSHSRGYTVVTGGEPMIQPEVVDLCRELRRAGQHITIETAGTVFRELECDLMSVSPKLANSVPWERQGERLTQRHNRLRIQYDVLEKLIQNYSYQLKFVVCEPGDVEEVREIVGRLRAERDRVLLMPEGVDARVLAERGRWIAEVCKREGFRYCPRLQVELWGAERGR